MVDLRSPSTVRADTGLSPTFSMALHRADRRQVSEIARLGLPIAGTYGFEAGLFSVAALVIGTFGAPAPAAHAIVNQVTYIVFQLSVGISHGSSILISRHVARSEIAAVRRIAHIALAQGAMIAAVAGIVYLIAPAQVLRLFTGDADASAIPISTTLRPAPRRRARRPGRADDAFVVTAAIVLADVPSHTPRAWC